jgi:RHS repeat-associated protein
MIESTTRYLYDGLLPIAELDGNNQVTRHITRGLDLSGSMQGAGGIGGILAITQDNQTGYPFADGNGNISHIHSPTDEVLASYQYDPYGNKLTQTGPWQNQPYQWSSKEHHQASGLVYYLFRFYLPELGRWPNRDPIEEAGGFNLYAFALNGPNQYIDEYGFKANSASQRVADYVSKGSKAAVGSARIVPGVAILAYIALLQIEAGMPEKEVDSVILINKIVNTLTKREQGLPFEDGNGNLLLDYDNRTYKLYDLREVEKLEDMIRRGNKDQDLNRMRIQLQHSKDKKGNTIVGSEVHKWSLQSRGHFSPTAHMVNNVGVLKIQMQGVLTKLKTDFDSGKIDFPNKYADDLKKAIGQSRNKIQNKGPVYAHEPINVKRMQVEFKTKGKCEYRIDVENLKGDNLKY